MPILYLMKPLIPDRLCRSWARSANPVNLIPLRGRASIPSLGKLSLSPEQRLVKKEFALQQRIHCVLMIYSAEVRRNNERTVVYASPANFDWTWPRLGLVEYVE